MKKIVSLLLVVMLMMTCMVTTVSAAEPGNEVSFTFSSSGNPGFATYGAGINYDATGLELVEITDALGGGLFSGTASTGKVGYVAFDDIAGDVSLFTATFKVKEDAPAGDYSVSAYLDTASTANAAAELVSFDIVGGGSVTVTVPAEPTETEPEPSTEPIQPSQPDPSTDPSTDPSESTPPVTEGSGNADDEPKTGDITPQIVMAVASVIAVAAAAMFVFKRKAA